MNNLTEEELRALELQLSCPSGAAGIEVGKTMNATNSSMTLNTIALLDLQENNVVLELGHGNCEHLNQLLSTATGIQYYGLEISETMLAEALQLNPDTTATFSLYNGETIPFADAFFDKMMTVNTIYFWANPIHLIQEIERTLKPMGVAILTYADKEFMKKLPFVGEKFALFGKAEIEALVGDTNLEIVEFKDKTEQVKAKTGALVERQYSMVKLRKS